MANAIGTLSLQFGGSEKIKPRHKDGAAMPVALQAALFGLVEAAMNCEAPAIPPVTHRVFVMAKSAPLEATASPVHRRDQLAWADDAPG